jgi:4'-phosphopantetheinyl transferase
MVDWLTCLADDCSQLRADDPPGFLSAAEHKVLAGLRFPKRRREWILGRWTAKQLLQRSQPAFRELSLQSITVGNDADGAPYLRVDGTGRLSMSLSISHREDRAFCALSPTLPPSIGADLESVEPRDPAFVRDFYTAGENARVWACPPPRRDLLVTAIWSAKEAVLKALRHGLRVDTRTVEILHVAGIEKEAIAAEHPTKKEPVRWPPAVSWHAIQVKCLPDLLPDEARAGLVSAWWRPWDDYVLTLASFDRPC